MGEVVNVYKSGSRTILELMDKDDFKYQIKVFLPLSISELPQKHDSIGVEGKVYLAKEKSYGSAVQISLSAERIYNNKGKSYRFINNYEKIDSFTANWNGARKIEKIPSKVAIVSSENSKGYKDFENNCYNSYGKKAFSTELFNANLSSSESICDAIRKAGEDSDSDVVAIVRGGGSPHELILFDESDVVGAIAELSEKKPVVFAVGHKNDQFIAHKFVTQHKSVPADAANYIVKERNKMIYDKKNASHEQQKKIIQKMPVELKKPEKLKEIEMLAVFRQKFFQRIVIGAFFAGLVFGMALN